MPPIAEVRRAVLPGGCRSSIDRRRFGGRIPANRPAAAPIFRSTRHVEGLVGFVGRAFTKAGFWPEVLWLVRGVNDTEEALETSRGPARVSARCRAHHVPHAFPPPRPGGDRLTDEGYEGGRAISWKERGPWVCPEA